MRAFAYQKHGDTTHPHNTCDICSGQPKSKSRTRQEIAKEIKKEELDYLDGDQMEPLSLDSLISKMLDNKENARMFFFDTDKEEYLLLRQYDNAWIMIGKDNPFTVVMNDSCFITIYILKTFEGDKHDKRDS